MDQQSVTYEIQAPGIEEAPSPDPLAPFALTLSLLGIAGTAVLLCCLIGTFAFVILVAKAGRDGAADFLQDLKFDGPLNARLGAGVVSVLYTGLAAATIAAAILRGGRRWRMLVALTPVRPARRAIALIVAVTLAYAALATYAIERARDNALLVSGSTDLVLLATIMTNLIVLAPVAEELLFRGWIYTALRRRFRFWPSFTGTVVLFAAIHWDANHRRVLQVLPLALGLGLLRERAGSIKPTIALHSAYNLIIVCIRLAFT